MYLLDTHFCEHLIREKSAAALSHLTRRRPDEIALSALSLADLRSGIERSSQKEQNESALERFLIPLGVLPFDIGAALVFGKLQAENSKIPPLELMVASQAISQSAVLVSSGDREDLAWIKGLKIENWTK